MSYLKNLGKAIYDYAVADSGVSALVGTKVAFEELPQGTEFPYISFGLINNILDRDSAETWERTLIEFRLYRKRAMQVARLCCYNDSLS